MGEAKRRQAIREGTATRPASSAPGSDPHGYEMTGPPPAPGKSCGSCTLCCKVLSIPELKKRSWEECRHVAPGLGCKIYSERPACCRNFMCGWLLDPNMGPDLKPENCHVLLYQLRGQNIVAMCDADYPDAWRKPNVTAFLHQLARATGPQRKVILMEKGRTWFVTESAIVPSEKGSASK
jgi:hypothetical protein